MKIYSLRKLVEIAKSKSPFYKNLYKNVKISRLRLSDLPIIDEDQFWKANSYKNNQVITEPKSHGILLRSGGTSGEPKTSVFSSEEWRTFCKVLCSKLNKAKLLRTGDCVANMFASGALYGSFLFISDMLHESSVRILELPIGLGQDIKDSITTIKELKVNVVMSTPYLLVALAYYIKSNNIKGIKIDRFLYGADLMLDSQYRFIKSVFPKATITSAGYASTDAGFLGYADSTCKMNEFRTDNHFTIMEIVDEKTGEVIEGENIKGKLITTNLTKSQMPVIRYPVGDLAMWCEPKGRKFRKLKLMGRHTKKDELLTFGGIDYEYLDIYEMINKSKYCENILALQILLSNGKMTIKIAGETKNKNTIKLAKDEIKRLVLDSIPGLNTGLLEIEFVDMLDLSFVMRTYKIRKLIRE